MQYKNLKSFSESKMVIKVDEYKTNNQKNYLIY